jgi:DNA-binding PucR family transcriptional regulator
MLRDRAADLERTARADGHPLSAPAADAARRQRQTNMPTTSTDLDAALRALADVLRANIPRVAAAHDERLRDEIPELFVRDDDPDFVELTLQSYHHQLRFLCAGLADGLDLDRRDPPAMALEEARSAAGLGIQLSAIERGYRICHRMLFEDVLEWAADHIGDSALRADVLRAASRRLFEYFDWLTIHVSTTYERERELLVRDRERRRRRLVASLLDGEPVDGGQLGYDLARDHLAVIAWGSAPERTLAALREHTGLSLLSVAGTDTTAWGWLGAPRLRDAELRAVCGFEPPVHAHVGLGEVGHGVDGFRLSHRQAWNAYRVARGTGAEVTWYADVALLALTLQDPRLAREFVTRELGPLAGPDARSRELRSTLVAYFARGHNATAAAAVLGVHDRTVLNRIRAIEDRLGHPITARREELAVALRLVPMVLGDAAVR